MYKALKNCCPFCSNHLDRTQMSICDEAGVGRPMPRRGPSPGNSRTEGFPGAMEAETSHGRGWEGVGLDEPRQRIDGHIEWHDTKGVKGPLDSMGPLTCRQGLGLAAQEVRYGRTVPGPIHNIKAIKHRQHRHEPPRGGRGGGRLASSPT